MRGGRRIEKPFRERGALAVHELHFGPNMTPMVDVVMVILIFFMASTALLGPEWFIRAHVPGDQAGAGVGERFELPEVRMEGSTGG
ncbi:MAG: biopolymer transporter ExbD [Phycisphaerales bacterium]